MAALLKTQKPIAVMRSAWCPGGRIATKALLHSRVITASTACTAPPTPRRAASRVPGESKVSPSICT